MPFLIIIKIYSITFFYKKKTTTKNPSIWQTHVTVNTFDPKRLKQKSTTLGWG